MVRGIPRGGDWQRGLDAIENAVQIHIHNGLPVLRGEVGEAAVGRVDACTIHQNIQAPVFGGNRMGCSINRIRIRHIQLQDFG